MERMAYLSRGKKCKDLGLVSVAEVAGELKGGDHSAQIEELKRQSPDFVIVHGWVGDVNASLIKQCTDHGLNSQIAVTFWGSMKSVVDMLGPDAPAFLGVTPFAFWWMDEVPMIRKIKAYTAKHYPDVTYRSQSYMLAFTSGLIFVECLRRADAAGEMNTKGLINALQTLRDFDTGGLTPPLTLQWNRFPVARMVKSNPRKGAFDTLWTWDILKYFR